MRRGMRAPYIYEVHTMGTRVPRAQVFFYGVRNALVCFLVLAVLLADSCSVVFAAPDGWIDIDDVLAQQAEEDDAVLVDEQPLSDADDPDQADGEPDPVDESFGGWAFDDPEFDSGFLYDDFGVMPFDFTSGDRGILNDIRNNTTDISSNTQTSNYYLQNIYTRLATTNEHLSDCLSSLTTIQGRLVYNARSVALMLATVEGNSNRMYQFFYSSFTSSTGVDYSSYFAYLLDFYIGIKLDTANSWFNTISQYLLIVRDRLDTVNTNLVANGKKLDTVNTNLVTVNSSIVANGVKLDTIITNLSTVLQRLSTIITNLGTIITHLVTIIQGVDDVNAELDVITNILRGDYNISSQEVGSTLFNPYFFSFKLDVFSGDDKYTFNPSSEFPFFTSSSFTAPLSFWAMEFYTSYNSKAFPGPYLLEGVSYRCTLSYRGTFTGFSSSSLQISDVSYRLDYGRVLVSFLFTPSALRRFSPFFRLTFNGTLTGTGDIYFSIIRDDSATLDKTFQDSVNPGQATATQQLQQGVDQLESLDESTWQDVTKYTSQLNFGLSDWSAAAAGISYIGSIFMLVWENIPTQPIVLSLMLGLCMLILGRGARIAGAAERVAQRSERRTKGE